MILQGQVGPSVNADGNYPNIRQGKTAEVIVSELNGRYYEQTSRQGMFSAATQAGQTTSAGLTTTYVGLCVSNPLGNTKNLAVNKVSFAWTVIAAAVNLVAVGVGYSSTTNVTHTTPTTTRSNLFGIGAPATALADTAATLSSAPVYFAFLADTPTGTTNPTQGDFYDFEGSLVIPPGGYVCTLTSVASSAAGFWASIQWQEVTP